MALKKPLVLYGGFLKELASTDTIGSTEQIGEEVTGSVASTITLGNTPVTGSLRVYKNGVRLSAARYSLAGAVVTLTNPRTTTDIFIFDYRY